MTESPKIACSAYMKIYFYSDFACTLHSAPEIYFLKFQTMVTWKGAIFEVQLLKLWQTLCDVTQVLLVLLHLALLCLLIS